MEEEVKKDMPALKEPVTITLFYPVKLGQSESAETVAEIKLRRPKGKDMRDIPAKPNVGDILKLAGRLSGQPPVVFDLLEIPDFNRVTEAVGVFLDDGQSTGGTA